MRTKDTAHESSLERVTAAAQHARMLMFREETLDEIDENLGGLAHMIDRPSLEAAYEMAIELLAQLPPDEFDRMAEQQKLRFTH